MSHLAVVLTVAAAASYGLAATLQHRSARQEQSNSTVDPRLLVRLFHRPLWLLGGAADLLGAALHATALAFGPLALVQPILVSGLLLAIVLQAAFDRRRPGRRELFAVGLSAAGLATFMAVAQPQPGTDPEIEALAEEALVVLGGVAVLIGLASRSTGSRRATLLGIAAGAMYALAAALAKAWLARLPDDDLVGPLTDGRLYAFAGAGILGLVLNQNAFQAGALAGAFTGITLTDPLVSLAIATTAFGEQLAVGGLRSVVLVLAALAMARGIWLASTVWSGRGRPPAEGQT
jgi:hypothetical protein